MAKASKNPIEVKIGVQHSPREISLEVDQTPEQVYALVDAATADGGLLHLTDIRGRQVAVPASALTYVEIGPPHVVRVGFGAE